MVKESKDYIEELQKYFPELCKKELKEIIDYGLKAYAYSNIYGADVLIKKTNDPIVIHTGPLGYDTFTHYKRWIRKYSLKERVLYTLTK